MTSRSEDVDVDTVYEAALERIRGMDRDLDQIVHWAERLKEGQNDTGTD